MYVYKCPDVRMLLLHLNTLQAEEGSLNWYFRGQSDSTYTLSPGLFRRKIDAMPFEKALLKRMRVHLEERSMLPERLIRDDDYLLALAQHYGAPTRLLDWTRSPEVATYFAASGALREKIAGNGECCSEYSVFAMAEIYAETLYCQGCKFISPPTGGNDNMAAQRGIFMKHGWEVRDLWQPARAKFANLPPEVNALADTRLMRFDVPTASAAADVEELLRRGFDGSSTFPGVRGIVESAWNQSWYQMISDKLDEESLARRRPKDEVSQ